MHKPEDGGDLAAGNAARDAVQELLAVGQPVAEVLGHHAGHAASGISPPQHRLCGCRRGGEIGCKARAAQPGVAFVAVLARSRRRKRGESPIDVNLHTAPRGRWARSDLPRWNGWAIGCGLGLAVIGGSYRRPGGGSFATAARLTGRQRKVHQGRPPRGLARRRRPGPNIVRF